MSHPADTNYIIIQLADGFAVPASYGTKFSTEQGNDFCLIENRTEDKATDIGYTPGAPFPAWITNICPNAPDCTLAEAQALIATFGASGSNWFAPIVGP